MTGLGYIVSATATLQSMSLPQRTFASLVKEVFLVICKPFSDGAFLVDFVADTYPDISFKGAKHPKQFKSCLSLVRTIHRLFSSSGQNGQPTLVFWLRFGKACIMLSSLDGSSIVKMDMNELSSSYKEEATHLLLHAAHASKQGHANSVIHTPATDVAVLTISSSSGIIAHNFFPPARGQFAVV